jgi:hypothetical protein
MTNARDYADENGYTLEFDATRQPANRWVGTATLKDADGKVIMRAESDPLHSERSHVIIPIAQGQALKRLEEMIEYAEASQTTKTKPKRKNARKIVEENRNDG